MKSRILIAFFVLGNSLYLCGAANPDKLSSREAMQLFTQITGTFNVNKSIAKGVETEELPALKQRIKNAETILLGKATNQDRFKQQTLAPLQSAFKFVNEKVSDYHKLYQTLIQKEDTEWNVKQLFNLAKLFETHPKMSTKLYNQIVKAGDTATLAAMANFLKKTNNNKEKAIILAFKFPTSRYMIPETYRLRLLVDLIEQDIIKQDINNLSQFDFQRTELGKIIKGISSKVREKNFATAPETWKKQRVPWSVIGAFSKDLNKVYSEFQQVFKQKNGFPRERDLETILRKNEIFQEGDIKRFLNELEGYLYLIKYRRAGVYETQTTETMLKNLRKLYPTVTSDLDQQLLLNNKYEPTDLLILNQASGYDAILLGVIKEVRELKRQYIEKETQSSSKETQSSSWSVL